MKETPPNILVFALIFTGILFAGGCKTTERREIKPQTKCPIMDAKIRKDSGLIPELLAEHNKGRGYVKAVKDALNKYKAGNRAQHERDNQCRS